MMEAIETVSQNGTEATTKTVEARLGMLIYSTCENEHGHLVAWTPDTAIYKLAYHESEASLGAVGWNQIFDHEACDVVVVPPADMPSSADVRFFATLTRPEEGEYDRAVRSLLEATAALHKLPVLHGDDRIWETYDAALTRIAKLHEAISGLRSDFERDVALGLGGRWVRHDEFHRQRERKRVAATLSGILEHIDDLMAGETRRELERTRDCIGEAVATLRGI